MSLLSRPRSSECRDLSRLDRTMFSWIFSLSISVVPPVPALLPRAPGPMCFLLAFAIVALLVAVIQRPAVYGAASWGSLDHPASRHDPPPLQSFCSAGPCRCGLCPACPGRLCLL